jgi:hypothetical protein
MPTLAIYSPIFYTAPTSGPDGYLSSLSLSLSSISVRQAEALLKYICWQGWGGGGGGGAIFKDIRKAQSSLFISFHIPRVCDCALYTVHCTVYTEQYLLQTSFLWFTRSVNAIVIFINIISYYLNGAQYKDGKEYRTYTCIVQPLLHSKKCFDISSQTWPMLPTKFRFS